MSDPDLDRWSTVFRRIEPLPGGVFALRRRLRQPARDRTAYAAIAASAAMLAVLAWLVLWSRPSSVPPDRAAAEQLFSSFAVPPPQAVALGLAERSEAERAAEPRVHDGVVFFWVAPVSAPDVPRRYVDVADPRDPALQLRVP